jgi:hypothetical protein
MRWLIAGVPDSCTSPQGGEERKVELVTNGQWVNQSSWLPQMDKQRQERPGQESCLNTFCGAHSPKLSRHLDWEVHSLAFRWLRLLAHLLPWQGLGALSTMAGQHEGAQPAPSPALGSSPGFVTHLHHHLPLPELPLVSWNIVMIQHEPWQATIN